MSADRELNIRIGADASELNRATQQGAQGLQQLGQAGKQAGADASQGTAAATAALKAEAEALKQVLAQAREQASATRAAAAAKQADAQATAAAAAARRAEAEQMRRDRAGEAQADAQRRQQAAAAMREEMQAMRTQRAEANLLKQANRQLAMQMTDVVTSVASGMPIWMVAIQQGGQIRDAYGGAGAALRAILGLITPTALGLGALGLAAGVASAAFYSGWQDSKRYAEMMALTGNTVAVTEGQFNRMVATVTTQGQVGARGVREMLEVLAASGQQTGSTLDASARAAIALSRVNGKTAAETAASFAGMGDSVADWAAKANRSYNYLTAEQFKQIMALEAQGRTSEAVRLNMQALAETMESRNVRSLGYIEEALKSAGNAFSNFWERASGWGRAETVEERLAKLRELLADPRWGNIYGGGRRAAESEVEQLQREAARSAMRASDQAAAQAAEQEAILKASRGYQDSLLAIQQSGDQLRLAQQTAAFDAQRAKADEAYAEMRSSAARYRDELIQIERGRLAAQEEAARRAVAIEAARVVKTEQEANARAAAVIAAQAKLAGLAGARTRLEADYAGFRGIFDLKPRSTAEGADTSFRQAELAQGSQIEAQIRAQAEATLALARAQAQYVVGLQQAADARTTANARDLAGMSLGDGARSAAGRQAAIADRFNSDLAQLQAERAANRIGDATLREREAALRAFYNRALDEEAAYQEARARIEADAGTGFERAMANYAERSRNVAAQSERAWTDAFQGMEDAIVGFAITGKSSFGDLVNSVVAGLLRIYLQQQLLGMFGGSGGLGDLIGQGMRAVFGGGNAPGGWANPDPLPGGVYHGGGQVGRDAPLATRLMPASTWRSAPRLHTGTGLASNEYAAILQRDESVLTPGQMRQLAPAGRAAAASLNLTVVNNTGTQAQATARQTGPDSFELLLEAVDTDMAGRIGSGQGAVSQALQQRFGLRPTMGG